MSTTVHAYAALEPGRELEPYEYELPDIRPDQVEIAVSHCGICHSDLSMLQNEWEMSEYPLVPGHEAVGTVAKVGEHVPGLKEGDRVGLGWYSGSCMHCRQCLGGEHHLCGEAESTIVGRHGGFADRVRCHWAWAMPIPDRVEDRKAGPLFCGGATVFNPIARSGVSPTDRVGVIGIGGLGHLAVQFLAKWGCHVTAFTSSPEKADEARQLGAHEIVNSRDDGALDQLAGSFDFILNTANVTLNWQAYLNALGPQGRLHIVGAVLDPLEIPAFGLIMGEKTVGGSPVGGPALVRDMLDFCDRHTIAPVTEDFPLSKVNDALAHLAEGKARYRIVLEI